MEDKKAVAVLTKMLKKYQFSKEEVEAVRDAIGILSWTKLVEGMTEARKKKRDRDLE